MDMFMLLNPFHPAWLSLHLIKYHTHKDVWNSGSIISSFFKLGATVQLHVLAHVGQQVICTLSRSGRCREEISLLPL
jgi:hypothetical protein